MVRTSIRPLTRLRGRLASIDRYIRDFETPSILAFPFPGERFREKTVGNRRKKKKTSIGITGKADNTNPMDGKRAGVNALLLVIIDTCLKHPTTGIPIACSINDTCKRIYEISVILTDI